MTTSTNQNEESAVCQSLSQCENCKNIFDELFAVEMKHPGDIIKQSQLVPKLPSKRDESSECVFLKKAQKPRTRVDPQGKSEKSLSLDPSGSSPTYFAASSLNKCKTNTCRIIQRDNKSEGWLPQ